jgi:hypothetical protein
MSFIDQVRIAAAHDEQDQNPVQREYEACLSELSDEERGELVRIINKLTQHLEAHRAAKIFSLTEVYSQRLEARFEGVDSA